MRSLLKVPLVLLAGALVFGSCDKNPLGTIDPNSHAPFTSRATVTPDSIYLDLLTPTAGLYPLTVTLSARASSPEGAAGISGVTASFVPPLQSTSVADFNLHDDGVVPDSAAGDGIYSAFVTTFIPRTQAGVFRIQITASGPAGTVSNQLDLPLKVGRRNSRPVLSGLIAPDTVRVPVGGSVIVSMSVAVADSDGLADVQQVYFRSLTSSTPDFKFFLIDDGGTGDPQFPGWPLTGDAVAGDGVYTVQIPLFDSPTVRRTNTFAFQAMDSQDTSTTLIHYLTVK